MNNLNERAMHFWEGIAAENPSKISIKLNSANDMTCFDADFLSQFIREKCAANCRILDLAAGTGLVLDKIDASVGHITAVEPFQEFSKYIVKKPYLNIVNATMQDFLPQVEYDLVSIFGAMHFFSADEAGKIYKKYEKCLSANGYMIVKNQFGLEGDVIVDGYSEQIGKDYQAHYRSLDHEIKLLEDAGFQCHMPCDIYPAACNRWDNTHYYALVARKQQEK